MQRFLTAALIAALPAGPAAAGAWTLPEGEGQVFFSAQRRVAPAGAQFGGISDEDEIFNSILAEYGLSDTLTAGVRIEGKYDATRPEAVEIRIGAHARYRFWQDAGQVASLQVHALAPIEKWFGRIGDNQPDSVAEAGAMAQYGRGWQTVWGPGFVSAGLGGTWRGEGEDPELRAEATVGQRPERHFMGLVSVFATVPLGDRSDPSLKIAPSIAYTDWPWLGANDKKPDGRLRPSTVQLGVAWDALNPEDGLALTLSLWRRF